MGDEKPRRARIGLVYAPIGVFPLNQQMLGDKHYEESALSKGAGSSILVATLRVAVLPSASATQSVAGRLSVCG